MSTFDFLRPLGPFNAIYLKNLVWSGWYEVIWPSCPLLYAAAVLIDLKWSINDKRLFVHIIKVTFVKIIRAVSTSMLSLKERKDELIRKYSSFSVSNSSLDTGSMRIKIKTKHNKRLQKETLQSFVLTYLLPIALR